MWNTTEDDEREGRGGVLEPFRATLANLVALLQTRLELAATELEEERERLKQMLLLGVVALFCAGVGLLLLTLLVVTLFWETHRLLALGALALLYLGAAVFAGIVARREARSRPRLFSATLAELAKDRERLTP